MVLPHNVPAATRRRALAACVLATLLFLVGVVYSAASAQTFTADRVCVIHDQPKAASASVGRLEIGETATVLPEPEQNRWIKVQKDTVQGWVYAPRGTLSDGPVSPAPQPATMHFYFGNIHSHTSEGSSEPGVSQSTHEDAFEYAADDSLGNLDFLAVTPHNHLVQSDTYGHLRETVSDATYYQPGHFVPIAGQEYSSIGKGNHLNVFELDAWINPATVPNGEFRELFLEFIPHHATALTFAQFNHPYSTQFTAKGGTEYGRDDFHGDTDMAFWVGSTDPWVTAIEIIDAPDHADAQDRPHYDQSTTRLNAWLWALSQGWHLGPTANQDNHRPNWGSASDSRTVAVAPELTREAICGALRARRFYASEDSTMQVTFRTGTAWMGSIVSTDAFQGFTVAVQDDEEPNATYTVELFHGLVGGDALRHDSDPFASVALDNGVTHTFQVGGIDDSYWFVKVTQSQTTDDHNGTADNAWTAPIWIEGANH